MKTVPDRRVASASAGEELITLSDPYSEKTLRVRLQHGDSGHVRLEQLAHDPGVGWYVQKSFQVPREFLTALATQLRKADCLLAGIPNCQRRDCPLRIVPASCGHEVQRREA